MLVSARTHYDMQILDISGDVDRHSAGRLYDALVAEIMRGRKIIVDVSRVRLVTHAGARGFIVAAKLLRLKGGQMRICGASALVRDQLQGFGFDHLVKQAPSISSAMLELSEEQPVLADRVTGLHRYLAADEIDNGRDLEIAAAGRRIEAGQQSLPSEALPLR